MKTSLSMMLAAAGILCAAAADVYMAGDSTMEDYPRTNAPQTGWGQALRRYAKTGVNVRNLARGGRSTESFISEGRWAGLIDQVSPGDFVIIQFGHNDSNPKKPVGIDAYRENMRRFIREVKAKKAFPVICTSIVFMTFRDGRISQSEHFVNYVKAAREVAAAEKADLIDLNEWSKNELSRLGAEKAENLYMFVEPGRYPKFPDGRRDACHLQEAGAHFYARGMLSVARDKKLKVAECFNDIPSAKWDFDENKGSVTADGDRRMDIAGSSWCEGRSGSALRLYGDKSTLKIPAPHFRGRTSEMTVSFDFKLDKAVKGVWLSWEGRGGFFVRTRADGKINIGVRGRPWKEVYPDCPYMNEWHNLKLVFADGKLEVLIDGSRAAEIATGKVEFDGNDSLTLSPPPTGSWQGFFGVIDNLQITPSAEKSPNSAAPAMPAVPAGRSGGVWRFDENQGSVTRLGDQTMNIGKAKWTSGRSGCALRFSGQESKITLPKPLFSGKSKKLTISMDVKIDRPHKGVWLSWSGTGGLFIRSRGDADINIGVRGKPWAEVYSPCRNQDQWHNIRVVFCDKTLYSFIDGAFSRKTATEDVTFSGSDTVTLSEGWNGFYGSMDNLQIIPDAVFPEDFSPDSTDRGEREMLVRNDGKLSWSKKFDVPDRPGYAYGSWERVEEKFHSSASSAAITMDGKNLYVTVKNPIPSGMTLKKDAPNLFSGEHIEFFLRPDPAKNTYFQYCAGADGKTFTAKYNGKLKSDENFRSRAVFRVDDSPREYTVHITIPRDEVGLSGDVDGMTVSGNICRSGATCGGISTWQPGVRDFHDADLFGKIILGSYRAYWDRLAAGLRDEFNAVKGKSGERSAFAGKLAAFDAAVRREGDRADAWKKLDRSYSEMRAALLSLSLSGKNILIHRPDVWENRLEPSVKSGEVKKITLTAAMNSRVLYGFVVSNLSDKPFLGQIKCFEKLPSARFWNQPWNDFLRNITFYEGIRLEHSTGAPIYDPLAPLHMKTLLRAAPHTDVPVWMTISTAGLKPGTYKGVIVLKNSVKGFSPETVELELKVLPVDLGKVRTDNFHYAFITELFADDRNYTDVAALYRFLTERYTNMMFAGHLREVYPELNDDGTLKEIDFSSLDKKIQTYMDCGVDRKELKLIFNLHKFIFIWRDKDGNLRPPNPKVPYATPAWEAAFRDFMRKFYDHLQKKFSLSPKQIIIYTGDEPEGDINDKKSRMYRVWYLGKLVREAVRDAALITNPVPRNGYDAVYMNGLKQLSRQLDYVVVLERFKTPEFLSLFKEAGVTIWTYSVRTTKTTAPSDYRRMFSRSFRENIGTANAFWAVDDYSGEGFDSSDTDRGSNYTDYGAAYCDMNHGTILSGRRMEAHVQGILDMKALLLCRQLIKEKGTPADAGRLDAIAERMVQGNCDQQDRGHTEVLNMIVELQNR